MLQTFRTIFIRAGALAVLAAFVLQGGKVAIADDHENASAFAVVVSEGRVIPVGDDGMRIMGTVLGPFFVDAGYGPTDAGDLSCLANMAGNYSSGAISGEGSCVIVSGDSRLFGDWTCQGMLFVGCKGEFVITGGDGGFGGATGGGLMVSRPSDASAAVIADRAAGITQGRGIIFWDAFDVVLP